MDAPRTLQQAIVYFSDYAHSHKAMMAVRWPDGVVKCPRCGSENVTYLETARVWKCYEPHPRAKFSLKVGTVFEDSPLPLQKWLPALWLLTNCKNGVSSYELGRALGITQKSAWFMLHRLRLALQPRGGGKLGGRNRSGQNLHRRQGAQHAQARPRTARHLARHLDGRKVAVMGLLERHSCSSAP